MKNYLVFLIVPLVTLSFNSCTQADFNQLANTMLSEATGGILQMKDGVQGSNTFTKPAKIKLSKSSEVISMRWSGDTPTAIIEGASTKGSQQGNGVYNFNPFGSKHYDLDVDFRKKTYILNQFDGAQLPTERGTIITL